MHSAPKRPHNMSLSDLLVYIKVDPGSDALCCPTGFSLSITDDKLKFIGHFYLNCITAVDPRFGTLHANPRFHTIVKNVGLP